MSKSVLAADPLVRAEQWIARLEPIAMGQQVADLQLLRDLVQEVSDLRADPPRCNICDQPILHELVCEDCLRDRGYVPKSELEAAEAQTAALRAYMEHKHDCAKYCHEEVSSADGIGRDIYVYQPKKSCTCGLDALIVSPKGAA